MPDRVPADGCAEPGRPHQKRALDRALRLLLLMGTCWYHGRQYSGAQAVELATKQRIEEVHAALGWRSKGVDYMPWLSATAAPTRQAGKKDGKDKKDKKGSKLQVWSYNCESCLVANRMAGSEWEIINIRDVREYSRQQRAGHRREAEGNVRGDRGSVYATGEREAGRGEGRQLRVRDEQGFRAGQDAGMGGGGLQDRGRQEEEGAGRRLRGTRTCYMLKNEEG